MQKGKQVRKLMGLSILLMPTMVMGKTSGTVVADKIVLKESPSVTQEMAIERYKGDKVEIIELIHNKGQDKPWYQIAVEDQVGFVEHSDLVVTETKGKVNQENLEIRSYPDEKTSSVIGKLEIGQQIRLIYKVNDFYKVYVEGQAGFVSTKAIDSTYGQYIQEIALEQVRDVVTGKGKITTNHTQVSGTPIAQEEEKTTQSTINQEEGATTKGEQIVKIAMKYLGTPYVYGGSSLTKGVDCSGFTQGVMKLMGINIPRTSRAQSQTGTVVSKDNLQKGDLLFFGNSKSSIFHTGIYIGNGKMIHSSTAKSGGVIIANAYTGGGAPLQVIRRV